MKERKYSDQINIENEQKLRALVAEERHRKYQKAQRNDERASSILHRVFPWD